MEFLHKFHQGLDNSRVALFKCQVKLSSNWVKLSVNIKCSSLQIWWIKMTVTSNLLSKKHHTNTKIHSLVATTIWLSRINRMEYLRTNFLRILSDLLANLLNYKLVELTTRENLSISFTLKNMTIQEDLSNLLNKKGLTATTNKIFNLVSPQTIKNLITANCFNP